MTPRRKKKLAGAALILTSLTLIGQGCHGGIRRCDALLAGLYVAFYVFICCAEACCEVDEPVYYTPVDYAVPEGGREHAC